MTKKRKLNSNNPKYQAADKNEKVEIKRVLMCNAPIRTASGKATQDTAAVYGVWYK